MAEGRSAPLTVVDGWKRGAVAPQPQKRVMITFLIRGAAGETWRVSREYALSFGPRSGLRKLLEQWRGRPYESDAQARAVDPRAVLEQPALVVVRYKEGSTWPILDSVLAMMQGLVAEPLRWPPVYFSMAQPCRETFTHLPAWVQAKVRASEEWGRMKRGNASDQATASKK